MPRTSSTAPTGAYCKPTSQTDDALPPGSPASITGGTRAVAKGREEAAEIPLSTVALSYVVEHMHAITRRRGDECGLSSLSLIQPATTYDPKRGSPSPMLIPTRMNGGSCLLC